MRYTDLSFLEEKVRLTGNNEEYAFRKVSIPVQGESLLLESLFCTPKHRAGYYYAVEHPKERIIIHFTAGNTRSDLSALTRNDYHVSVPFIIARDGTIYQLYLSKYWSGNIGKGLGNEGTGNKEDKCTIGIELSNYGYLTENGGNLETYYSRQKDANGKTGPVDVYCSLSDEAAYTKLPVPFRGQSYYATFTDEQYNSLIILLRYLTSQFNIPRKFLPEIKRFEPTTDVLTFRGIVSHINYRKDGKWDIGPAFDWNKVITGVEAAVYTPALKKSVEIFETETDHTALITSEDALTSLLPRPKDAAYENDPYDEETGTLHKVQAEPINTSKRRLYALLVGIADYASEVRLANDRVRFPKLSGCVSDANKIKNYLENDQYFETDIQLLTNDQAVKTEIARLFKEHLGRAEENDTVLFYFSGHGTQEYTDKTIFSSETDHKLESIVCYYNEENKDSFLLSDKELRWLINQAGTKNPHIVTIFDCCHSAGITRNTELIESAPDIVEKRIPFVFPERKWEHFIFSDRVSVKDIQAGGEFKVLPEGHHLQLSACESNESAVEVAAEGVFTRALLKVLKSAGGQISYQTLNNRVRQYLRSVYEQKPRIYTAKGDQAAVFYSFLKPFYHLGHELGEVAFNEKIGWQLNMGAIHGINKSVDKIVIIDPDNPGDTFTARPGLIRTDSTELIIDDAEPDKEKIYKASLTGLMSKVLRVFVNLDNTIYANHVALLDEISEDTYTFIELVEEESSADYILCFENSNYYLTFPHNRYRPLTGFVKAGSDGWINQLIMIFKHISAWAFIKHLINEDNLTRLPDDAVNIKIATGMSLGPLVPVNLKNPVPVTYSVEEQQLKSKIKIAFTNTSKTDLYCCAVYVTSNFQAFTGFLNPEVYHLEPGESVTLNLEGTEELDIVASEMMKWYNWERFYDYMKFVVSTEDFDATTLRLDPLPEPPVPGSKKSLQQERGIITALPDKQSIKGWRTYDVKIELINPEFNRISRHELQMMMEDDNTKYFAAGLYNNTMA